MTPLGAYIREIRSARNLTLSAMASSLCVTPAYLSALETGKRKRFPEPLIGRICRTLQLDQSQHKKMLDLARISNRRLVIPGTADPLLFFAVHQLISRLAHASPSEISNVIDSIESCPSYSGTPTEIYNRLPTKEGNMDSS